MNEIQELSSSIDSVFQIMSLKKRSKKISQSLINDLNLIPSDISDWWIKYLKNSYIRCVDSLT